VVEFGINHVEPSSSDTTSDTKGCVLHLKQEVIFGIRRVAHRNIVHDFVSSRRSCSMTCEATLLIPRSPFLISLATEYC
jgi:hypothetical protein